MKKSPRHSIRTSPLGFSPMLIIATLIMTACSTMDPRNDSSNSGTTSSTSTSAKSEPAKTNTEKAENVCRKMTSKDGNYDGCIYGYPLANSKFAKLTVGMTQYQAEKLLGHPQDLKYVTNWHKAWIPYYGGTDKRRLVWLYEGQGSVSFDTGSAYAEGGRIVEINYDPKIEL
jgi:hypothetical protein